MGNLIRGVNDLETVRPDLAAEWNYKKNGDLKPSDVGIYSSKKVWWHIDYIVPDDYPVESLRGKYFNFEWLCRVEHRMRGIGCPYLSNNAVWKGYNDLATTHPELAAEWHPTKNGELTPYDITAGSKKLIWWLTPYDDPKTGKHYDFEWPQRPFVRLRNGCPFPSDKAIYAGFNDFGTKYPELLKEWDCEKNGDLDPRTIGCSDERQVWWLLPYDVPDDYPVELLRGKHFDFSWSTSVQSRVYSKGCPFLSGQRVWAGFNDLETVRPDLAAQWHPLKNKGLTPSEVPVNSPKKIWWLLPYDVPDDYPVESLRGKHFDFEWCVSPNSRSRKNAGCPFLSKKSIWVGFNDFETTHPELAKEWHPTKNGGVKPSDVIAGGDKKFWWFIRRYDSSSGVYREYEWQSTIINRVRGRGCPYLLESYGEYWIRSYLEKHMVKYEFQKTFDSLCGLGGRNLSYDFFISGGKILIEYQGMQHYKPVSYFGGEISFEQQKEHDKRKRYYAKKHGYKLIEISYKHDTLDKVSRFLDERLLPLLKSDE